MSKTLSYVIDKDGIATLTIDVPGKPMNVMDPAFNQDFAEATEALIGNDEVKGIIITSAKNDFMAGADLKWLLSELNSQKPAAEVFEQHYTVNRMLRRLETNGKAVVAAINGTALGGGLELCLACHYRVAARNAKTRLGLPEVNVGLLPGGGGTQKLPRLIGVKKALDLLTRGSHVSPEEALELGFVDELCEPEDLLAAARKWLLETGDPVQPWDKKGFRIPGGVGMEAPDHGNLFMAATALVAKSTKGNYPAPQAILSAVYEGTLVPIDAGLRIESRYFSTLIMHPVARNMVRTLFVNKQAADKLARRPKGVPKREVGKLGILGAGIMGAGVAYVSAAAGINTVLLDRSEDDAERGKAYSVKLTNAGIEKGRTTREKADRLLSHISTTADYSDLAGCDLVIEAVFEDRVIKANVTRQTEAMIPPDAVFASNTSTLPITGLATAFTRPDAFIGLHFFSPVDRMPLLEIILGEKTSDQTLAWALDYAQQIRKTPIVVRDSRGFYTSRVFATFTNEGMALLKDGVSPALIENAASQAGMAVGPLSVSDEVTIELIYKVDKAARADLGDDYGAPSAIDVTHEMVEEQGRLGRREGKGFYEYPQNGRKFLWPGLGNLYPIAAQQPSVEEVKNRILYIQALESARCLDEGVIMEPADADIGSILGWGFPTWTGGTLSLIETVGLTEFAAECDRMAKAYGPRFLPNEALRRMAAEGKTFYD
ncbi:MAG: 3-hydroxyacyl-CoA dehydrogenase NAD-binding domain-containing protein [Xanthomonadales bacterium]|nr:3-hydroxyacyl-CoA dehydrogenase NAD-binding domain-containing protein [Xanthomonadales bacterium]